jgi:hypothetical protein
MARYKIEYTYDDTKDKFGTGWYAPVGASAGVVLPGCVEEPTVTRLPDPPVKQRFIVEIEFPAAEPPTRGLDYSKEIQSAVEGHVVASSHTVTVTPG